MVKFISFGSGSSGNCYYLNCNGYGLLIDAGVGIRVFKKLYKDYGLSFNEINALLITHDHYDHVKAVGAVSHNFKVSVYATAAVHGGIQRNYKVHRKVDAEFRQSISHGEAMQFGPFCVTAFAVPHDSSGNTGYFIEADGVRFALITDAGCITDSIRHYVAKANYLVVEANYEDSMLEQGSYPQNLRNRIRSPKGHLANHETGELLAGSATADLRRVWLCHLSEENNTPAVALATVAGRIKESAGEVHYTIEALNRRSPSGIYELE